MPIALAIPINIDSKLYALLQEILRRAPDVTVVPLFVDYNNQRVLIGATAVGAGTAGKLEVTGDIRILGSTAGVIMPETSGSSRTYRIQVVEVPSEDGSLQPELQLTRVD